MDKEPKRTLPDPLDRPDGPRDLVVTLFVYGTLKQGYSNHGAYCSKVLSVTPAALAGKLFQLACGYPVLAVPEEMILADGTADPLADALTQRRFAAEAPRRQTVVTSPHSLGNWNWIQGELLAFDDPATHLPPIDGLEGFLPNRPCIYRRVLIPVRLEDGTPFPAWVYVLGVPDEPLRRLSGTCWTGES